MLNPSQLNTPIPVDPDPTLVQRLPKPITDFSEKLDRLTRKLSDVFPGDLAKDHLHIIVEVPGKCKSFVICVCGTDDLPNCPTSYHATYLVPFPYARFHNLPTFCYWPSTSHSRLRSTTHTGPILISLATSVRNLSDESNASPLPRISRE
jgi:hypothetical protein